MERRVHEQLLLNAVTLQSGIGNTTADADGRVDDVLSRDEHIVFILIDWRRVPAVEVQQIGQAHKVATSDFSVLVGRY